MDPDLGVAERDTYRSGSYALIHYRRINLNFNEPLVLQRFHRGVVDLFLPMVIAGKGDLMFLTPFAHAHSAAPARRYLRIPIRQIVAVVCGLQF